MMGLLTLIDVRMRLEQIYCFYRLWMGKVDNLVMPVTLNPGFITGVYISHPDLPVF